MLGGLINRRLTRRARGRAVLALVGATALSPDTSEAAAVVTADSGSDAVAVMANIAIRVSTTARMDWRVVMFIRLRICMA